MRQVLVAALAMVLLAANGGQASAELEGFVTNDVVQSWRDRSSSPRQRESRRSRRAGKSAQSGDWNEASIDSDDSFDDDARPQRRGSGRSQRQLRSLSGGRSGSLHGIASYYWQPQRVASGGWFNPNALTAAHKTLPFGTRVRVTHLGNGRSVVVRINDRGPYVRGRIIDLSKRAAGVIGMQGSGVARVSLEILGR